VPYRFCTPDQETVAIKAKILDFLKSNREILDYLKTVTQEVSVGLAQYWGVRDDAKLSIFMSQVFGATPSQKLQEPFVKHLLKARANEKRGVYFDALGPIVVALTFYPGIVL
jgi:hypothetical protein